MSLFYLFLICFCFELSLSWGFRFLFLSFFLFQSVSSHSITPPFAMPKNFEQYYHNHRVRITLLMCMYITIQVYYFNIKFILHHNFKILYNNNDANVSIDITYFMLQIIYYSCNVQSCKPFVFC